jgi:hypothetical protein
MNERMKNLHNFFLALVTTLAGTVGITGKADGVGTTAKFSYVHWVMFVNDFLFVSDSSNHLIRTIDLSTGTLIIYRFAFVYYYY